ncbi:MAG: AAA family ATPase [Pseudomonadota bacterium]
MNKIVSSREMIYIYRRIAITIRQIADVMPVVVVTGARQVGKSTLLQKEFSDYDYVTLDDYALLEQSRLDPQSLWVGKESLIIDEAQKCPQLFHAIKQAVDASNRRKRFILSGSVTPRHIAISSYWKYPILSAGCRLTMPVAASVW